MPACPCRRSDARNMSAASSVGGGGPPPRDHAAFCPPPPPADPPRGRRVLRFALTLPLYALAGGLFGALFARTGLRLADGLPSVSAPALLAGLLLGFWPNIVLHEAGHALAGMARGMRPFAFGIGPWRWERGQSAWRMRHGGWLGGAGGFAALLPQGTRGLSRVDQTVFLFGGPLANLLTAGAVVALLPWVADARLASSALAGFGLCALFIGVLNLVPFHAQGWRTDGRGLLDLLQHSPDADMHLRIQQVMALTQAGVRPRDWPDALVPAAGEAPRSPMLALNGALLRLAWAMDRDDATAAGEAALRATARLNELPAAFRPHAACALAGHAARTLGDGALLAAWRPLCEGGVTDLAPHRAWLDVELAALSGTPDAVNEALAKARGLLDRTPDPVTALLLGEYLDALEHRSRVKAA